MINKYSVTVLTTAYNAQTYIKDAISSILDQSFKDFEFIILDDCSTDDTLEIIENFANQDHRIKVVRNSTNLGITASRNKLIDLAQGKYIVWQDADDISLPDRIESLFNFMEASPDIGIAGGYLQFFDETGDLSVRKYDTDDFSLRKKIFRFSPVAQPAAMVRREVFAKVGSYNPDFKVAEDIDLSFRIGEHFKFGNLAKVILKYRQHQSSSTFEQLSTMEKNTLTIRKKFYHHDKYHVSFVDRIFNFTQVLTLYILPGKLRIKVFNFFRNS